MRRPFSAGAPVRGSNPRPGLTAPPLLLTRVFGTGDRAARARLPRPDPRPAAALRLVRRVCAPPRQRAGGAHHGCAPLHGPPRRALPHRHRRCSAAPPPHSAALCTLSHPRSLPSPAAHGASCGLRLPRTAAHCRTLPCCTAALLHTASPRQRDSVTALAVRRSACRSHPRSAGLFQRTAAAQCRTLRTLRTLHTLSEPVFALLLMLPRAPCGLRRPLQRAVAAGRRAPPPHPRARRRAGAQCRRGRRRHALSAARARRTRQLRECDAPRMPELRPEPWPKQSGAAPQPVPLHSHMSSGQPMRDRRCFLVRSCATAPAPGMAAAAAAAAAARCAGSAPSSLAITPPNLAAESL